MDDLVAALHRQRASRALVPLFFVSGATGLVYQTVWGRQLHLVFGTSTFAIATVLTAFMAGLALGGWWVSRRVDRLARPLRVYGVLEVLIGAYALVFPAALEAVQPLYLGAWRAGVEGPVAFGVVQFLLVGGLLVPPTVAMGATLPVLARFAVDGLGTAGDRIGLLYGVNTLGAVVGTWLAGFVLLPGQGLWTTTVLAAAANVLLGVAALAVDRTVAEVALPEAPAIVPPRTRAARAAAWSAALAGFSALVLEVAWFRILGLMLGASVYAFSTMLLAFLVGIALGGRAGGPVADRLHARGGADAVVRALALVQLAVGALSVAMVHLYQELPFWYVWLFDALGTGTRTSWAWATSLLLAGVVMTPPALLMGVAFPLAARAAMGREDGVGGDVGRIYAANTAGGVLGAALAGFLLLPWLAVKGTVLLAALVYAAAGVAAWWGQVAATSGRQRTPAVALAALLLGLGVLWPPRWDPLLMTAGMYKYVTSFKNHTREGIHRYAVESYDLLYYAEGLSSVVTVAKNRDSENIWLANNGKVDASTTSDMPTQLLVSLLPLAYADRRAETCVIGLASGITAGAVTLYEDVERVDVVELEPATVPAARIFTPWNFGLLDDPRTRLILDDGRNHVLRAPPEAYDVLVSEPSNPWITGVSNLFTAEFFALGRERVRPGGTWGQWVQLYGMDDEDLRSLLATFADTWPHVLVWWGAEHADLVLVAADHPLEPTYDAVVELFRHPDVVQALAGIEVHTPVDVLAAFLFDRDGILALAGDIERNTDDNMRIEHRAPRNLHVDTQDANLPMLKRHAQVPAAGLGHDPVLLAELARAYRRRDDPRDVDTLLLAALTADPDSTLRADGLHTALQWWLADEERLDAPASEMRALEAIFLRNHVQPLIEAEASRHRGTEHTEGAQSRDP